MTFLALNLLKSGLPISMVCAAVGLFAAFLLIRFVTRLSPGNDRMREIASAVQEGAKAYLNRQVITISVIAVVIFVLLFIFKDAPTAVGFLLGAFCSLVAGYVGMRVAVLAKSRGSPAGMSSRGAGPRGAVNGGGAARGFGVGVRPLFGGG